MKILSIVAISLLLAFRTSAVTTRSDEIESSPSPVPSSDGQPAEEGEGGSSQLFARVFVVPGAEA
jgi:hypothetical protein